MPLRRSVTKLTSLKFSGNRRNWISRWPHLNQHLVKPLQGTMQMDFNPAWCTGNILAVILSSPAFDKTQANRAHLRQLIHCLITIIDRLWKQLGKFLAVENFKGACWRNLAHCCWMKAMNVVTISTLHKDCRVTEAFSKNLSTNIIQMHSFTNMSSSTFNGRIAINIRQETQTESLGVCRVRICESIYKDAGWACLELFTNSVIQLIVRDRTPRRRLLVINWGYMAQICKQKIAQKCWNVMET